MSKFVIILLSLLFLCGDIYANDQTFLKEDGEDVIIFGDDDENNSTETDDITDAEDEEEEK